MTRLPGNKRAAESPEQMRERIIRAVSMDPALEGVDMRVFMYIIADGAAFEDHVHIPQVEMVVKLNRYKTNISRAIRRLVERGVIIPSSKGVRASEWKINPDYGK